MKVSSILRLVLMTAVIASAILSLVSCAVTIHGLSKFESPESGWHLPFNDFDSRYSKIKAYHILFMLATFIGPVIAWYGSATKRSKLIHVFIGFYIILFLIRLIIFVTSNTITVYYNGDDVTITEFWLAYGTLAIEITVLTLYACNCLIAFAFILSTYPKWETTFDETEERKEPELSELPA